MDHLILLVRIEVLVGLTKAKLQNQNLNQEVAFVAVYDIKTSSVKAMDLLETAILLEEVGQVERCPPLTRRSS